MKVGIFGAAIKLCLSLKGKSNMPLNLTKGSFKNNFTI